MLNIEIINRREFFIKHGCHPKDSLIIVVDGSFNCKISSKSYQVSKNEIFAFNKNSYFERNVIVPIKCIYIQFDSFPVPLTDGIIKFCDSVRISNTILHLEQAIKEKNESHIKHFLDDIFIMCRQHRSGKDSLDDKIVSACIDFFNKNYRTSIILDILTKEFHISKQWLIKKFKKYTNRTPIEYLNEIRLDYGKKFLMDNDLSIGNIAEKCGFDNVYYFSNTFKKYIGMSPSQYRKSFRL